MISEFISKRIDIRSVFLVAITIAGSGTNLFGQAPPIPTPAPAEAEHTAKEPASGEDFRFAVAWVSTGGSYLYVPGKWGELHLNLVNARNEPRELMCATYFDVRPTLQFCRKVWVPARSTIRVSHPALFPDGKLLNGSAANLHTLVMDASEDNEVLVKSSTEQLLHDGTILVSRESRNTAVIGLPGIGDDAAFNETTAWIEACRSSQNLNRRFTLLLDTFLPTEVESLESFDQVVIQDDRIVNDLAAVEALRRWVFAGGTLWVMLDKASPAVLETLFGDDFHLHVVDRIDLTSVRVDEAPSPSTPAGKVGEVIEYEEPIELVRVVTSNLRVLYSVSGWPASLKRSYGDGQVFVTTLGARGWIKPRGKILQQKIEPPGPSEFIPIQSVSDLVTEIFKQRGTDVFRETDVEPRLREHVGYSIPPWSLIVGTLIGFCSTLLGMGFYLDRRQRLEYFGLTGALTAVVAGCILLVVGGLYRHAIPGSVISLQFVEAAPGTNDVQNRGMIGVYQPEGSRSPITVTRGGTMLPDMTGLEDSTRRLITTDLGVSHWEHLDQPAGLRITTFRRGEMVEPPLEARATFDSKGLVGAYTGAISPGADALVASNHGRIGVQWKESGAFDATVDNVFAQDQFLGSGLLSDEQNRRRQVLQKVLSNPRRKDYPQRPQLMFWTDRWDHGIRFDNDLKVLGASLVTVPLTIHRPPPGTELTIPAPFLPYSNRLSPDGRPGSAIWNQTRQEWEERSTPGTCWLGFQVPLELQPITVNRARIDVKVSGPIGRIEVLGRKNDSVISLKTIVDPVGSLSINITDADVLTIQEDGSVVLGFGCGDPERPELTESKSEPAAGPPQGPNLAGSKTSSVMKSKVNYWRIESLELQLWGSVPEQTAKD